MKIAFLGAVPFNLIFGGGETQLINTMNALKLEGIDVSYYDYWDRSYKCDIIHIFGCHYWIYHLAMLAKFKDIKIVLSPISYNPNPNMLYNIWKYIDPLIPVYTTYRLNRRLLHMADVLLPNSEAESDYIIESFGVKKSKIKVIPNAADIRYADSSPKMFIHKYHLKDFVLCVGKIEPRKNQLNLVKALNNTNIKLVLIGDPIPQCMDYYYTVMEYIQKNKNMLYINSLQYDSDLLASAYSASKVHVLLGKNETPGIVNLEAGLAGANLVVAECPPPREYLGDFANYCDANSLVDIRNTIMNAMEKPKSYKAKEFILKKYTWQIVARKTLNVYNSLFATYEKTI